MLFVTTSCERPVAIDPHPRHREGVFQACNAHVHAALPYSKVSREGARELLSPVPAQAITVQ